VPAPGSLDTVGLGLTEAQIKLLKTVDVDVWREEASLIPAFYEKFGDRMPKGLWDQLTALKARLEGAAAKVTEPA
jgi:phosphoenolpyruvate carboxykinase (GTP)